MRPSRRTILKGGATLACTAGMSGVSLALPTHGKLSYVIDSLLPEAQHLAARAHLEKRIVADPAGEIITLLLEHGRGWLADGGSIIGLTGYSDYGLAHDMLRSISRPIRHVTMLDGTGRVHPATGGSPAAQRAFAALLGPAARDPSSQATSFLWLA